MMKSILLFFILANFFVFGFAQSNDSQMVIWAEDFSGCYYMPSKGMNASYQNDNASISLIRSRSGGNKPECAIGGGGFFKADINLCGTYGDFNLQFKVSKASDIVLMEDNVKGKKLAMKSYKGKIATYIFHVNKGISHKTIYFKYYNAKSYIDDIRLTASQNYGQQSLTSPNISFSDANCDLTIGERIALPALKNPNNQKIYYWSSDRSVATVDANGKVTPVAPGKTTIYAICHGDSDYSYQEVSYTLNVKRKAPKGEIFYESFDKILCEGGYGDEFSEYDGLIEPIPFDNAVNPSTNNLGYAYKCICLSKMDGERSIYAIGPFKGVSGKKCTLSFRTAGQFYPREEEIDTVTILTNGNQKTYTFPYKISVWNTNTLVLDKVLKDNSVIEISGDRLYLDDVSLVVDEAEPITDVEMPVSHYRYSTLYYSDRALTVPVGMKAYTMKVEGDSIVPSRAYDAGQVIPKGEAVLLHANQGSYTMSIADANPDKDPNNQLKGTDESELTTDSDDCIFYLFGVDKTTDDVGFFWGEENGDAFINGAHKAYLPLKKDVSSQAAKALKIVVADDQTTNISSMQQVYNKQNSPCYNLSGQRVGRSYHGIVIRNGKKVFQR